MLRPGLEQGIGNPAADGKGSKKTKFVSESTFSLALPEGWERIDPPAGATFAAVAADGGADATLWITEDPKLEFPTFITESLRQLETLAGSARVVERVPAPTADGTIHRGEALRPLYKSRPIGDRTNADIRRSRESAGQHHVLIATMAATLEVSSASGSPIGPPKSWTTRT